MQLWRFLLPSALGFTLKNGAHQLADKLKGAPARTVQAAQYVAQHARPGDPEDVLRTLDRFATEVRWMMNVGPDKGPLIQELADRLPHNARILEIGAYSGYSSILIANAFGADATILSIEINADAVASSRANVEVAGLSSQVRFLHGPSSEVIATLEGSFDLVFLDHMKELYLDDLQLIEQRQLIHPGSIVVADNVGEIFGADAYLDYVRSCGHYQTENRQATIEYTAIADAVEIAVFQPQTPD
jgi:catechol O-methyltransferase